MGTWWGLLTGALLLTFPQPVRAFPPYRSTDADTAAPRTLEARLGALRVENERGGNAYSSPLLRLNFGLPAPVELISEFEYRADEGRTAEAAVGFKWVPIRRGVSVGVETLTLLPVSSRHRGAGVESQILATWAIERARLHVNGGGFYDGRPEDTESGWRASALAEFPHGRIRPGLEIFAKRTASEAEQVLVGSGVIVDIGRFDVRVGVHAGLTAAAPDATASLWVTTKFPVRQGR